MFCGAAIVSAPLVLLKPVQKDCFCLGFFSCKLTDTELRYSTFDPKLLAAQAAIKHFRHFCEGRAFHLWTDHNPFFIAISRVSAPISPIFSLLLTAHPNGWKLFPCQKHPWRHALKLLTFTWISRFGMPETITSDRGTQFTSSLWLQLCEMLNISPGWRS
jgi:hypothetical protein